MLWQNSFLFNDLEELARHWRRKTTNAETGYWLDPICEGRPWHSNRITGESEDHYAHRLRRLRLLYEMGSPQLHRFVEMCRRTIDLYRKYGVTYLRRHNTDPMKPWLSDPSAPLEEIRAFLRKMEVYNSESCIAVIKAYLLCTCEASDPSFWPAREAIPSATFDGIKDKTGLPRLWLEDLAADLLNRPLRQATDRRTTKTLLWNTRTGDGEIFDLVLETIPYDDANHERTLYPNPLFSLVMLDMDFVESMNSAWQSVTQTYKFKPGNYDIRWSFQSHRHPLPNYIAGPSASGALASALANLFAAKQ